MVFRVTTLAFTRLSVMTIAYIHSNIDARLILILRLPLTKLV